MFYSRYRIQSSQNQYCGIAHILGILLINSYCFDIIYTQQKLFAVCSLWIYENLSSGNQNPSTSLQELSWFIIIILNQDYSISGCFHY